MLLETKIKGPFPEKVTDGPGGATPYKQFLSFNRDLRLTYFTEMGLEVVYLKAVEVVDHLVRGAVDVNLQQ